MIYGVNVNGFRDFEWNYDFIYRVGSGGMSFFSSGKMFEIKFLQLNKWFMVEIRGWNFRNYDFYYVELGMVFGEKNFSFYKRRWQFSIMHENRDSGAFF